MTQRELADRAYLHWSTISKVEQGTRPLSLDVARACDVAMSTNGVLAALALGDKSMIMEHPVVVRIAPQRYFRPKNQITYVVEAERAGQPVDVERVTVKVVADEYVAERLGIRQGEGVSQTNYLIRMGGEVVTRSKSWEPLAISGGTVIEHPHTGPYADQGVVARFDAIGRNPTSVEEVLHVRLPDGDETRVFGISPLTQLIEVHQTFLAGSTIIEAADMVFPSSRYEFHYRMEIPPA